MKKRRLKRWVKVVLGILLILLILSINAGIYHRAVEKCVNAGHDLEYCENGLR